MKTTTAERYAAAVKAACEAEAKNMSASTQNKRWWLVFAIQDEMKVQGVWS